MNEGDGGAMRLSVLIPALLLLSSAPASAGWLVLANPAPERLGTVAGVYRMDERAGSSSFLELEWTDEAGQDRPAPPGEGRSEQRRGALRARHAAGGRDPKPSFRAAGR